MPALVYSDHGTNFVGANKELGEIYKLFDKDAFRKEVGDSAISKRIEWLFNPPLSSHFGGIWEAAAKCSKHHLKRIVKSHFIYEQLSTLLIEIKGFLIRALSACFPLIRTIL